MSTISLKPGFQELNLTESVLKALDDIGYETPSNIQEQTIPHVLAGRDVVGQAQTGTGKTAAFVLPLLCSLNLKKMQPQVLVLVPTRELAVQVAKAFEQHATYMKGFRVLPIYGGKGYDRQLAELKSGLHVVVGTPGRIMDHMRRGTLKLDALSCLVLDEADEMLRMGFIEDVEWILENVPSNCQMALFSATMPNVIRRIAYKYLKDPKEITIKAATATVDTINQRYWLASGVEKFEGLVRILEAENFEGILIFVRTKSTTLELAEKLVAHGYNAAALNGDVPQNQRERTVELFKRGKFTILVATDVAARGIDIDRISHVINYDIPQDVESYVHRIGRTGRAGRGGEAILFVAARERRILYSIERATRQKIESMDLPSAKVINEKRINVFKGHISEVLSQDLQIFKQLVEEYQKENETPALEIAAALAKMVQGNKPFLIKDIIIEKPKRDRRRDNRDTRDNRGDRGDRGYRDNFKSKRIKDVEPFRIEVGRMHGVKPGNIVGAISNEAQIEGHFIGHIDIYEDFSVVELPKGKSEDLFRLLKKTRIAGQLLKISKATVRREKREKRSSFDSKKVKTRKKKSVAV